MFRQCKAITRTTSNQHKSHIINNMLIRIQYEKETNTLQVQEGEVLRLDKVLPEKTNTIIPYKWIERYSTHYKAHLERISDHLVLGPGVWWQYHQQGVEFFDVSGQPARTALTHHFRSFSLQDVDAYLLSNWEQYLDMAVELPARHIRAFTTHGELRCITSTNPSTQTHAWSR